MWEARNKLDDIFLLLYSDNFAPFPLDRLYSLHKKNQTPLTFMVSPKNPGNISLDKSSFVQRYDNNRFGLDLDYVEIGYMIVEKERTLKFFETPECSFSSILHKMAAQEQTVPQAEADVIFWSVFTPRMVNKREKILLHPVTALMSYRQFDQLNVAILNASLKPNGAHRMAEMLTKRHKLAIEKKIGAKLNIVNISSVREQEILPKTKIYFHANLLKQTIKLAQVLPGEQLLEPVPTARASKLATDVEIFVGKNFE